MRKTTYIFISSMFAVILWSANPMNVNTTISWYGQGSLLNNQEFSDNQLDDEDTLDRKRRHRRRRKIRPPKRAGNSKALTRVPFLFPFVPFFYLIYYHEKR